MNYIQLDHIMFPVYNNDKILDEIKNEWKKKYKNYKITVEKKTSFKAIYLKMKKYYIEYLSTIKGEHNWTNALCVKLDKKYWSYYKKPDQIDKHFMIPKFGCGFFIVDPKSPYTKWCKAEFRESNFEILISKKLKKELINLGGLKWKLPKNIKTNKNLCQSYDILVVDKVNEDNIVAPLFQANQPFPY